MPISPAARTVRRTASSPRRWPSTRGSPRAAAQRPLPSLMMATWRGTSNASRLGETSASDIRASSDGEDLLFLRGQQMIDLGNTGVGGLLYLAGLPVVVAFADLLVVFALFEQLQGIAPHMPPRVAGGRGVFVRNFHQFLAPLFVELGNAQADGLPFG